MYFFYIPTMDEKGQTWTLLLQLFSEIVLSLVEFDKTPACLVVLLCNEARGDLKSPLHSLVTWDLISSRPDELLLRVTAGAFSSTAASAHSA